MKLFLPIASRDAKSKDIVLVDGHSYQRLVFLIHVSGRPLICRQPASEILKSGADNCRD